MIAFVVICLISSTFAFKEEFTTVKIGNQKTLNCDDKDDITWTFAKNSTDEETPIEADDKVYKIAESKLVILSVQEDNLGNYKCKNEDDETLMVFEVSITFKLRKMPKSISIDEGSPAEINCSLHSSGQEVIFKWFSKPEYGESSKLDPICSDSANSACSFMSETNIDAQALFDKRDKSAPPTPFSERSEIVTGMENNIPYSTLKIKEAFVEDRKIYVCQAILSESEDVIDCKSSKECSEVETILRVKDPLAAVWPFIGIVAEVILLCVIIFFCERRKSDEKDDYDEGSNGNSIRQKK